MTLRRDPGTIRIRSLRRKRVSVLALTKLLEIVRSGRLDLSCAEREECVTLLRAIRTKLQPPAAARRRTHCYMGHERTPENLDSSGACRLCKSERERRRTRWR